MIISEFTNLYEILVCSCKTLATHALRLNRKVNFIKSCILPQHYTASQPRTTSLWKAQNSQLILWLQYGDDKFSYQRFLLLLLGFTLRNCHQFNTIVFWETITFSRRTLLLGASYLSEFNQESRSINKYLNKVSADPSASNWCPSVKPIYKRKVSTVD